MEHFNMSTKQTTQRIHTVVIFKCSNNDFIKGLAKSFTEYKPAYDYALETSQSNPDYAFEILSTTIGAQNANN